MKSLASVFSLLALCSLCAPAYAGAPDCSKLQPADQKPDVDSLKRVERAWLVAEYRGDTDAIACILDPSYTEISVSGNIHHRVDIMNGAAKRKGNTGPIPTVDWTGIQVNGDSATAYSVSDHHDKDGKPLKLFATDTFLYHDGAWHAYFSVNAVAVDKLELKD